MNTSRYKTQKALKIHLSRDLYFKFQPNYRIQPSWTFVEIFVYWCSLPYREFAYQN